MSNTPELVGYSPKIAAQVYRPTFAFFRHFPAALLGCTLLLLPFAGCVSGPDAQELEEQERIAASKNQKQQRQTWLKAKAMWVKQAAKCQIAPNQPVPIETWKALLLVKRYPVEVSPIPSKADILTLLGPPAKTRSHRETQGQ